ncbi:MAG: hypothetical protein K5894_00360 [Lachnospiraceae bacterium]|nr:hypothetical protein [Lachnospiraceae bacterium]
MQKSEIELTRTVDLVKKERLINSLVKARVSYLERWVKVPFFERRNFGGKKEVCVVYVNTNQVEQAREILENIEGEAFSDEN